MGPADLLLSGVVVVVVEVEVGVVGWGGLGGWLLLRMTAAVVAAAVTTAVAEGQQRAIYMVHVYMIYIHITACLHKSAVKS